MHTKMRALRWQYTAQRKCLEGIQAMIVGSNLGPYSFRATSSVLYIPTTLIQEILFFAIVSTYTSITVSCTFQTTPSSLLQISSLNPFIHSQCLQTFPRCFFPNFPHTVPPFRYYQVQFINFPKELSDATNSAPIQGIASTTIHPNEY